MSKSKSQGQLRREKERIVRKSGREDISIALNQIRKGYVIVIAKVGMVMHANIENFQN